MDARSPVLDFDGRALSDAWGRAPVRFTHPYSGHPLLSVAELTALAGRIPPSLIEHHLADLPLVLPRGDARRLPQSPGQVARDIEGNGCWMMFSLQTVGPYAALLSEVAGAVGGMAAVERKTLPGGIVTVFMASPGARVPVHFDRHHNFLLHLAGHKEVTIGTFSSPRIAQIEIERNFAPAGHNAHRLPEHTRSFELGPGDGLYIPPYAFHWVTGGAGVSVSLSCAYRTVATRRRGLVHQCNAGLRRHGVVPRPPEESALRDLAKLAMLECAARGRELARRLPRTRRS